MFFFFGRAERRGVTGAFFFFFPAHAPLHTPTPTPTPLLSQGVDRIIVALAPGGRRLLLRHYAVALKKSGGRVPRVALTAIGPAWSATVTRHRAAPPDLEKAALKKVDGLDKKKASRAGVEEWMGRRRVWFLFFPWARKDENHHPLYF